MRSRSLLLATVSATMPRVFFNTNAGATFWVCATPQPADLAAADYAALTWVQVKGVGSVGEAGTKTNMLNYPTWDTMVLQKAKGIADAGNPALELARIPTDPGQIILRAAAKSNLNYAFRIVRNDKPDNHTDSTPTIIYNRGLIDGPTRPQGRNESFDLETFALAFNQHEVVVDPVVGTQGSA